MGDRRAFFRAYNKGSTAEGNELVDVVLAVMRDQNASNRERMEAATWLADRGFGKPTVDIALEPPEDRRFTIEIGDPPAMRPKHSYTLVTPKDADK